ncbi:unnamed protein product [Staurois parvus]|uniref:Uncharacterized protein n=1 Tax=Staurois parvus TaxID=386267 RepID=A0ABN9D351_9NEOB|nr:unnamed protein product [Staurois parvus]
MSCQSAPGVESSPEPTNAQDSLACLHSFFVDTDAPGTFFIGFFDLGKDTGAP